MNQKYLKTLGHRLNASEKSEVLAQTPPFRGGVWARTTLFSVDHLCDCGGETLTSVETTSKGVFSPLVFVHSHSLSDERVHCPVICSSVICTNSQSRVNRHIFDKRHVRWTNNSVH